MKIIKKTRGSNEVMGFVEHLSEFRNRLIVIIAVLFITTLVSFHFSSPIINLLIRNAKALGYQLVYLAPAELFTENIRLSLISGVVFTSPVILFEIWAFVRPGLKRSENTIVFLSLLSGLGFFVLGAVFAYIVAMPIMLNFFITFDASQQIVATISIQNYLSFVLTTVITFGLVFEMPVVTLLLTQLGLLKAEWLTKSRRIIIVVIFVIGAIITPPDIISQILVSIPMLILFEISVLLSKMIGKRKMKMELENE